MQAFPGQGSSIFKDTKHSAPAVPSTLHGCLCAGGSNPSVRSVENIAKFDQNIPLQ